MIKEITVGELKKMTDKEGLILQGCGGDLKEWEDGVNELLTESGVLLEGDTFKNVYVFEKYSLQGTTQGRYLTGGVPPVRFSM